MPKCDFNKVALLCNFIEIALLHGCSPVNLLHIFRTPFLKNTSGGLRLTFIILGNCFKDRCIREAILESNSSILSGNSRYKLTLNVNGELDIHCATQQIWSTNTVNSNATKLHFQDNGNLVLRKNDGSSVWATNTLSAWWNDPKPEKLVIQDNGNLVLYLPNNKVAWASHSISGCQNGECKSRKIDLTILSSLQK